MNAYSIHTPEYAEYDVDRTFLRLEFSVLDNEGIAKIDCGSVY
jgi:hypothetical protein